MDLIGGTIWTITIIWLYVAFPFDFASFAAIVPGPLRFLVSWITDGRAKIILLVFIVGSALIPFFAIQLRTARRKVTGQLG